MVRIWYDNFFYFHSYINSNTYVDQLHPNVIEKVNEVKIAFPSAYAILSNSVGTLDDVEYRNAINTEKNTGIPVIRHKHKKPQCLDEVFIYIFSIHFCAL